ncbi:MAG TPA: hypothetical protein VFY90_06915 [Tepidiformaceae bacterium]|nr:hypothetical protein [Tepidiformaceae bacterium]
MRRLILVAAAGASVAVGMLSNAAAHAPSGAIFTTVVDGSEVNFNHYDAKEDVYLDGGPGPGAPQEAAGLDDGTYVFMVTDPSGKKLLSTDAARCRQFTVADGVITGVVAQLDGCEHDTGTDIDHNATTVQLMPYDDTPNPGGVYKVWVTFLADFPVACLATVDCSAAGTKHGFDTGHTKTDNFKVGRQNGVVEIDTLFFQDTNGDGHKDPNEDWLLGRTVTWTDTHGASNKKWSYYAPQIHVNNEAHVEAPEPGTHTITIPNQAGCNVGLVHLDDIDQQVGPQSIQVEIQRKDKNRTVFIEVACTP